MSRDAVRDKIPPQFLPLFESTTRREDDSEASDDDCAVARTVPTFMTELAEDDERSGGAFDEKDEYDFSYDRCHSNARAALRALKFALENPPCAPLSERLISDVGHLKLTASAQNRRIARDALAERNDGAPRRGFRHGPPGSDGEDEDDAQVRVLECTLRALKMRVAALEDLVTRECEERPKAAL